MNDQPPPLEFALDLEWGLDFVSPSEFVDEFNEFIAHIRENDVEDLTILEITGFSYDNDELIEISKALETNTTVDYVVIKDIGHEDMIADGNLHHEGMISFMKALKNNKTIRRLCFDNLNIANNDIMLHFSEALTENTSVTDLEIFYCTICRNRSDIELLSNALKVNGTIERLVICNNKNPKSLSENMYILFDALSHNKSIRELDLNCSYVEQNRSASTKHLSKMITLNNIIQKLKLTGNIIGNDTTNMQCLFDALRYNTSIKHLELVGSGIKAYPDSSGLVYISEMIRFNTTIEKLYLCYNDIGKWADSFGMEQFSKSLQANTTIRTLNLANCNLKANAKNISYLSDVLTTNKSIQKLKLSFGDIELQNETYEFLEMIENHTTIESLTLCVNSESYNINDETVERFIEAMKLNTSIRNLKISSSTFTTHHGRLMLFSEMLRVNTTIRALRFFDPITEWQFNGYVLWTYRNEVPTEITSHIFDTLRVNPTIQVLDLLMCCNFDDETKNTVKSFLERNKHNNKQKDMQLFGALLLKVGSYDET